MTHRLLGKLVLSLSAAVLMLSACAVYDPGPQGFAEPGAASPESGYLYGPPMSGSLHIGGGWHSDDPHWR